MKNPLVAYALIRIGIFAAILTVFLVLRFNPIYATLVAAALAFAISLVFLSKLREEASKSVYQRIKRESAEGIKDADTETEDAILDKKN
jgi:F0F1-type ATP synthase membrane subunit b/b'